ncbi:MAG: acyl-CoA dehydrogenase family protein [Ilumatobacteraceae bacterium]
MNNLQALIDAADDEEFHDELRTFLDEHVAPRWGTPPRLPVTPAERREALRDLQGTLADGRWVGIHWPEAYGGRNATVAQQIIYNAELAARKIPAMLGHRGLTIVGPTLIRHGTNGQQERFLERIRYGQDLWAGGFSEPDAGSDLASLRTRGVIDGETIVVTGQKIWTSGAHFCNWIYTLVRTDPEAPKHKGISVVAIPLDSPGIEIRPIRQITGSSEFNEVFFEDVVVPTGNIIGRVNDGWNVNRTTLSHEHSTLFIGAQVRYSNSLADIVDLASRVRGVDGRPRGTEPGVQAAIGRAWAASQLMLVNGMRNVGKVVTGGNPGPEGSIMKIYGQESEKALFELALDIAGPRGLLDRHAEGAVDRGKWLYGYLGARAATIGGGTSEIHRNKIAENVLGLPRDLWTLSDASD